MKTVGHKQKVGALSGGGDVVCDNPCGKAGNKAFLLFPKQFHTQERHRNLTVPKYYSKYLHYLLYYSKYYTKYCSPDVSKWFSDNRHFFSCSEIGSSLFYPLLAVFDLACILQEINLKWSCLV